MGIKDLLRFMRPYIAPVHIKKYTGKRVGIDAYSWLHKGAYSCSMELVMHPNSDKARRYIQYFMHHINLLRHYKIIPVVVFDGGNLPMKAGTESERHRIRGENLALAKELLRQGDIGAATEYFQRAVSITPAMAYQLIQTLRRENVEFVVAPYEADAQLAYLSKLESNKVGIEAVITEDSDLMAYGCKAIIFKMDRYGKGEEIVMENVFKSLPDGPSFKCFNEELFTGMCVLAGCDFLSSVPGIGIKRAHTLVSKYRNLDNVLSLLKVDKHKQMPKEYVGFFKKAMAIFHHARVFNVESRELQMMKPLPKKLEQLLTGSLDVLGPELPPSVAIAIAEGNLDPISKRAFSKPLKDESHQPYIPARTSAEHFRDSKSVKFCDSKCQISKVESCFTIFPANVKSEERNSVKNRVQGSIGSINYSNEAIALEKLIAPVLQVKRQREAACIKAIPNNNPFKKRKVEDDVDLKLSLQCSSEAVSEITVLESSDGSPGSQESVKSKLLVTSALGNDESDETMKKPKTSKCICAVNKKSGILGFFARILN